MKLLYPNQLPLFVRRAGRTIAGPQTRAKIAANLQHLAHVAARRDSRYRHSLSTLAALHNQHAGQTCVIIGNGPSIATEDFSKLSSIPTFCLNRGYLMWREQRLTPSYLVAVNDLVIEQFHSEISEVGSPVFVPWTHRANFSEGADVIFLEMRWHRTFFTNPVKGIWAGATVTFAAMQLAYHMGFSRVILIGVDHRFKDTGPAHAEIVQQEGDANHFSPDYFGKGVRWNLPDLEESEFAYRLAKSAFEADGRKIIDCTHGGALTVFEKMNLDDALQLSGVGART